MKLLLAFKVLFAALVFSFAAIAWACFWDSDTLRTEAKGMPGVVEAVTGFFPVYPDEYYQRRIEIAEERLAEDPDRLGSYDDIAVSLDRLGDSTGAIAAIEPKLAVVERLGDDAGDHLYSYHANIGTFYAHRWIRRGGNAEDLSDLELARDHIAKAIEINPDAHFGREFVQLGAIEWLLNQEAGSSESMWSGQYPTLMLEVLGSESMHEWWYDVPEAVVDGLVGLVMLGAARESVDVFTAIAIAMNMREDTSLGLIAALRVDELIEQGKRSIHPVAFQSPDAQVLTSKLFSLSLVTQDFDDVSAYYRTARESAEEYRKDYAMFVKSQLDEGLHPDTHAGFFDAEPQPQVPKMPNGLFGRAGHSRTFFVVNVVLAIVASGFVALCVGLFWIYRKRIWVGSP